MDEYKHKIVAVDWWKDRPHEVYTCGDGRYNSYDIDWSKEGQGYYHWSACWGGPKCNTSRWTVGGLPTGVKTLDQFIEHYDLIHAETVYCKICDDWMLEDTPCEHLVWDDGAGCWGGPGSVE